MSLPTNINPNIIGNPVNQKLAGINPNVVRAIKSASQKTGVSFDYLLDQARTESNFKTDVKSKTSSATGLYQFINSTWLGMIEKHGEKYGIDTDAKSKKEILDLRKDPEAASYMAAEFAKENGKHLQNTVGGQIGETDLYLAHFLGAGGAERFLKGWKTNPNQDANILFPTAAKANKNVFTNRKTGQARSLDEVYQFFANKFDDDGKAVLGAPTQVASATSEQEEAQPIGLPSPLRVASPYTRANHILRLASAPKMELPVLSPYTNMILAALDVPRGNAKGEGTVWFKGGGFDNNNVGGNSNFLSRVFYIDILAI